MKPYHKVALGFLAASFLSAVIASLFPKTEYSFQETALQSWFSFMEFPFGFGALITVMFGWMKDNI